MKNLLLFLVFATISLFCYSQPVRRPFQNPIPKPTSTPAPAAKEPKWSFKVGLMSPIPVDLVTTYSVQLGSTLAEADYKVSKKINLIGASGYWRFNGGSSSYADFNVIPVMAGVKYSVNSSMYIAASGGASLVNEKNIKPIFSPYIGFQIKDISVDFKYITWINEPTYLHNLALCFSYKL